jgi:hypothetical protein
MEVVKITNIISYDLVSDPGFISARMTGVVEKETLEERIKRIKKDRKEKFKKII